MRVIWLSNAPWAASGYGQQTALAVPRLEKLGYEMAYAANYGLQSGTFEWQGHTVFPANEDWGNPTISTFVAHHRADLVIALCDSWVMKPDMWEGDWPMAIWAPIDHFPIPPPVLGVLQHERIRPIAMSRDGEMWMQKFELDPVYVPHAVDTSIFKPNRTDRAAIRREMGIPEDAFLVGMVAANKGNPAIPRKGFPQAFGAFSTFAQKHDDAYLYVHTMADWRSGIKLGPLAHATGVPDGRWLHPSPERWTMGMSDKVVSHIYQAFDVLLNPSWGEGFGVPIVEAQACGVPVITSNHSAMPELTEAGWCVDGDPWWDALQESFFFMPHIREIYFALEEAYATRDDMALRERGVRFASQYDADLVAETYWKPAMQTLSMGQEVPPLKETRQVRRARERREKAVT